MADDHKNEADEPHVLGDNAGVHLGSASSGEPPIDFGNFIVSLAHGALVALGLVEHPELGAKGPLDLDTARHTLQMLEMLQEKTAGNRDPEEEKLLTSVLYELRMSYVNATAQKVEPGS